MCSAYRPGRTGWPTTMVAIWLPCASSSSSKVTISRLLWVFAQRAYASRWVRAQLSPAATDPSCMSSFWFGTTTETVGSFAKSVGNRENRRFALDGTLLKSTQGLCLRMYDPLRHPVYPSEGIVSEYPAKV